VPRRRQRLRLIAHPTHSVDFLLCIVAFFFYHARAGCSGRRHSDDDCWENITWKLAGALFAIKCAHPPKLHIGGGVRYTLGSSRRMSCHCAPSHKRREIFGVLLLSQQDDALACFLVRKSSDAYYFW
jgi:hypothetical protein